MKVSSIGSISSYPLLVRNNSTKDDEGTLKTKNLDEKQIFNYMNFTARRRNYEPPKPVYSMLVPDEYFKAEWKMSRDAKAVGVHAPELEGTGIYKVDCENASKLYNPIKKAHIKNVLDDLSKMDEIGLMHGDIEHQHVYYSTDSDKIMFDCFRFGYYTDREPERVKWDFSKNCCPTNALQYENNCIGRYIESMEEDEKNNFIKGYLPIAADFYGRQADYLKQSGKGTDEQIEYAELKSKLYAKPDSDIQELFVDRVEMEYNQRKYFTMWDEGMGACSHKPDEDKTIESVLLHFDSIQNGVNYYNKAAKLAQNADSSDKKKYFEHEKEYAKHFIDCRIEQVAGKKYKSYEGMAQYTLSTENPVNKSYRDITYRQRGQFSKVLDAFKDAPIESLSEEIEKTRAAYLELLKK